LSQGYVLAKVTDDDGNPVPSVIVNFYTGSNHEFRGTGTTDIDGYSRLDIALSDGEILEVVVNENNFYHSSNKQVTVAIPFDFMFIGYVIGAVCLLAIVIAAGKKFLPSRSVSSPPPSISDVSGELEKERDRIPERVRKHSERGIAELDGVEKDSGELSETLSFDDDST